MLTRRLLGEVPQYFAIESFRVMVEKRHNAMGELVTVSEASVKVSFPGEAESTDRWSIADGNGPVNALTRVLVETRDNSTGRRWMTIGVSPNIIDASFEALVDSINYKLFLDAVRAAA